MRNNDSDVQHCKVLRNYQEHFNAISPIACLMAAAKMSTVVYWVVMPCGQIPTSLKSCNCKDGGRYFSETAASTYKTTRCHNPEEIHHHVNCVKPKPV